MKNIINSTPFGNEDSVFRIGKLGKTHGIKGEITMQVDDDVFDRVDAEYLVLELDGIMVPFFIEEYRFKSEEVALMKFEGIDTQERAREFTGVEVFFPRELTPDMTEDDEISYAQLKGFTLIDANNNNKVGVIDFIDEQTMNIMFELTDGTLIPASEELIEGIDVKNRTITIRIPEGLLGM